MLCAKPWKQRESDHWETKVFQYSAKPNKGALGGKPLAHYFLALPWFILGLNKVGGKSGMVFLQRTWGMGLEEPTGHHEMGGSFPCALPDMPEVPPGPLHWFIPYLLGTTPSVSHSISSSRIQIRGHPFWKAQLQVWLGCLVLNSFGSAWILGPQGFTVFYYNPWISCPLHGPQAPWGWGSCVHLCFRSCLELSLEPSLNITERMIEEKTHYAQWQLPLKKGDLVLPRGFIDFYGGARTRGTRRELWCLMFKNATGGAVLSWLSKNCTLCPPNLFFRLVFTSTATPQVIIVPVLIRVIC